MLKIQKMQKTTTITPMPDLPKLGSVRVEISSDIFADINRNKSIRIYGTYNGRVFDKTFKIDDMAEYDSYNLSYYGEIKSITDKTVTIQERFGREPRKHRLKLRAFMWRNHNFDLDTVKAKNAETSHYI
jgi:hypothetical protein